MEIPLVGDEPGQVVPYAISSGALWSMSELDVANGFLVGNGCEGGPVTVDLASSTQVIAVPPEEGDDFVLDAGRNLPAAVSDAGSLESGICVLPWNKDGTLASRAGRYALEGQCYGGNALIPLMGRADISRWTEEVSGQPLARAQDEQDHIQTSVRRPPRHGD